MKLRPTKVNHLLKDMEGFLGPGMNPGLSLLNLGSSSSESVALENPPSLSFEHICRASDLLPRVHDIEELARIRGVQSRVAW